MLESKCAPKAGALLVVAFSVRYANDFRVLELVRFVSFARREVRIGAVN